MKNIKNYIYKAALIIAMILLIESSELIFKEIIMDFWEAYNDYEYNIDRDDYTVLIAGITIEFALIKTLFEVGKKFFTKKIEKAE